MILIVCRLIVIILLEYRMKNLKVILGQNIKELRKKQSLSQEKLAELSLLHRTYIGGIERAERNVCLDNIVVIAKALKVEAYELLKENNDNTIQR